MPIELQDGFYASPRWSWEILDCAMPMTFDTYSNCAFQCVYCFAFFQRAVGTGKNDYLHHKVRSVNTQRVKDLFSGRIPDSPFNFYINRRFVLQWGGMSDGFDYYERHFGKSLELMRFFREIDYPISISTKGTWFTSHPAYREVFRDAKNVHVKSSIITLDEEKAHKVERGASSSEERFKMLEEMNKLGVAATTVRFRPFILGISAEFPFSARARKQIDDFVHRTKEAGCYSLTTEFLCLESRASNTAKERYEIISRIAGFPMFEFYKRNSQSRSGLLRLNYDLKRDYIEAMAEACEKYGVRFFVSDAHHKEKSFSAGCCGLPANGPLSSYNRGQFAEAILIARRVGKVYWSDIAPFAEWLKGVRFYEAEGFNMGDTNERARRMYQTMYDYMRDCWNNPRSGMSPARYFGGALVPSAPDEHGDIVYIYNAPYVERGQRVETVAQLELEMAQRKAGNEMRADGGEAGHVAYDVIVNGAGYEPTSPEVAELMSRLSQARLNVQVYVEKERSEDWARAFFGADIVELPSQLERPEDALILVRREMQLAGVEWFWWIEPSAALTSRPRALLSEAEGLHSENPSASIPARVVSTGVQLVQGAVLTPEQRGAVM